MAWTQILENTQGEGSSVKGGSGIQFVQVDDHAGETWTLQYQQPDGGWEDTDITFTDSGIKEYQSNFGTRYRLSGGTVGAVGYITGASDLQPPP